MLSTRFAGFRIEILVLAFRHPFLICFFPFLGFHIPHAHQAAESGFGQRMENEGLCVEGADIDAHALISFPFVLGLDRPDDPKEGHVVDPNLFFIEEYFPSLGGPERWMLVRLRAHKVFERSERRPEHLQGFRFPAAFSCLVTERSPHLFTRESQDHSHGFLSFLV